jgi:hypothetical protein
MARSPCHAITSRSQCHTTTARSPCHAITSRSPCHAITSRSPCHAITARSPCHDITARSPCHAITARSPCHAITARVPPRTIAISPGNITPDSWWPKRHTGDIFSSFLCFPCQSSLLHCTTVIYSPDEAARYHNTGVPVGDLAGHRPRKKFMVSLNTFKTKVNI